MVTAVAGKRGEGSEKLLWGVPPSRHTQPQNVQFPSETSWPGKEKPEFANTWNKFKCLLQAMESQTFQQTNCCPPPRLSPSIGILLREGEGRVREGSPPNRPGFPEEVPGTRSQTLQWRGKQAHLQGKTVGPSPGFPPSPARRELGFPHPVAVKSLAPE